jgi:hypothetical protein
MRSIQRDGTKEPAIAFEPFLIKAVQAIVRMYDHARSLGRPTEDFAFELDDLHHLGLTNNYLRLLVAEKILKVGIETTPSGSHHRQFDWSSPAPVVFPANSGFILTDWGLSWSSRYLAKADSPLRKRPRLTRSEIPFWDADNGILWHSGKRILKICQDAYLQKPVLEAFQKQGWPRFVANPFPDPSRLDRVENLRESVKKLNQRLREHGSALHFYIFEGGAKVGWEIRTDAMGLAGPRWHQGGPKVALGAARTGPDNSQGLPAVIPCLWPATLGVCHASLPLRLDQ